MFGISNCLEIQSPWENFDFEVLAGIQRLSVSVRRKRSSASARLARESGVSTYSFEDALLKDLPPVLPISNSKAPRDPKSKSKVKKI
jgi:hypothetical protein